MTTRSLEWAAGLFEGEGCFSSRLPQDVKHGHRYACAALVMTDEDEVREFHELVGVGKVYANAIPANKKHSSTWGWHAQRRSEVEQVALLLAPWLSQRRLIQAVNVLAADRRKP